MVTSDDQIEELLKASHAFLDNHPDLMEVVDDCFVALSAIEDLIPQDIEKLFSGHFFPIAECVLEAEASFHLAVRGFYRESFVSLRTVLELGVLSVYWDKDDQSHVVIKNWLQSKEDTPYFKRVILRGILSMRLAGVFLKQIDFTTWVESCYDVLSNYVHVRGMRYANRNMWRSNTPHFSEASLIRWSKLFKKVVQIITITHVLKYPIAFQYTPIDEKFGLNGPVGTFLRPGQYHHLNSFIPDNVRDILQHLSDSDEDATALAKAICDQADITPEQLVQQAIQQDKSMIEMHPKGFVGWLETEKRYRSHLDTEEAIRFDARMNLLEQWARENGVYDQGRQRKQVTST